MGVKLDLISDIDMYHFIEKSMRGWVCYVGKRYSKASNKYMESYIKDKWSKRIIYYDAN